MMLPCFMRFLSALLAAAVLLSSGGTFAGAQDQTPRLTPDRIVIHLDERRRQDRGGAVLAAGEREISRVTAASPYRFDNDAAPAILLVRPARDRSDQVVSRAGYSYVHMDVRGTGRSGGEYHYQDRREQRDLYEVVEWLARQSWSQRQDRRHRAILFCALAMVHGDAEPAASWAALRLMTDTSIPIATGLHRRHSGQLSDQLVGQVRTLNAYPHGSGQAALRRLDYPARVSGTRLYDAWWKERAAAKSSPGSKRRRSRSASGARSTCI